MWNDGYRVDEEGFVDVERHTKRTKERRDFFKELNDTLSNRSKAKMVHDLHNSVSRADCCVI